jgi:rSAM/selenodomain-associated transferase 1
MVSGGAVSCVVVYGREPCAGQVKTRLAQSLGDELAARVYASVFRHTLREALRSSGRAILALAEEPSEEFVRSMDLPIEIQRGSDLGARMAATFERHFSSAESRVVITGSDCPWITAGLLDRALEELRARRVVLGPATDGGYWLVGQRTPGVDLFSDIPWSTRRTLTATRTRLRQLVVSWSELDELVDIDTAEDLDRVLTSQRVPVTLQRELQALMEDRGGAG